ncbi:methyl-accepting chemotaxis protein [Thiomicrorhabdus sp.]|uniref:methyl-accepting chemotaxis protein n=1 Tax=Thiomicrorhabdus sp. TaxID=2039724 RepID=UPI002AA8915E|nr:methyl-accepting chemotaxis protein [Thiomicrorhabdus sp.]
MISFDFSKPSILRNMFLAFMSFGFLMGVIFPIFANLFVEWKEGMLVWFILSCIIAGISIGLINFWLLNKMLLRRLQRIGEVANAISNNDVSHKCSLESYDFIGDMASSFNLMSQNLRTMIERILDVSQQLSSASTDMVSVTQTTQSGVEKQKSDTYNVAQAVETMNRAVEEMSNHAQGALNSVDEANRATEKGNIVVNDTVESISALAQQVQEAANVIKSLEQDSDTIGSILDVIKDIAEQTNLLALNAAIEAARAGEHGRGFAVVADEVRILASKTQESTTKIESTIVQLQEAAREAVDVMTLGSNKATLSVKQVNEAGLSLKMIETAISNIHKMNSQIFQASDNQTKQAELVDSNVKQISDVAINVSQGAEQTFQSCTHVGDLSNQLSNLIGQFKTK